MAALGDRTEADEAVQEACLTAWRRIDRLEDPSAFRAWLLRITWRKALDRRRSVTLWLRRLRTPREDDEDSALDLFPAPSASPADELSPANAIASSRS